MINLQETFNKYEDEFLEFDKIEHKMHSRPDIAAFLLLDKLQPKAGFDIICASKHDKILLDIDDDVLEMIATDDDVLTLVRCGVIYDSESGNFEMFV